MLSLVRLPEFLATVPFDSLDLVARRTSPEGDHALYPNENLTIHVILLPGAESAGPLAALIPLDVDSLGRVEALIRFWRSWRGRSLPPDSRVTRQQRRRLRLMLQAVDGRANGASYREIAEVIYGVKRVGDEPWKTSALRDSTIGFVEGGLAMIAGGYRQLLRHRRRS